MSAAGIHDVPFHFRISLLAGTIVETALPCNATTVSEVDPVTSPVWEACDNVFDDKVRPVPAEYELLLSVAGVHAVPFHFRISLLAGAIVETDFPCNATTVSEVDPVASPVWEACENVFDDKVIPAPAEYELLLSVAGVHAVPFHFKTSLLAGKVVETDDPFNWLAFQIALVLFAENVFPTREIPVPEV